MKCLESKPFLWMKLKKISWKHQCTDNLPSSAWYLFLSSPAYASKLCFGFHSTLFIAARQGIWWTVRPVWTFDCKRKKKKHHPWTSFATNPLQPKERKGDSRPSKGEALECLLYQWTSPRWQKQCILLCGWNLLFWQAI